MRKCLLITLGVMLIMVGCTNQENQDEIVVYKDKDKLSKLISLPSGTEIVQWTVAKRGKKSSMFSMGPTDFMLSAFLIINDEGWKVFAKEKQVMVKESVEKNIAEALFDKKILDAAKYTEGVYVFEGKNISLPDYTNSAYKGDSGIKIGNGLLIQFSTY